AVAAKMAALGGGGTRWRRAWLPALQLLRRGSKAVTRHWKAMHFQRQKLLALTEYLPPRPAVPPRCLPCHNTQGREVGRGPGPALQGFGRAFSCGCGTQPGWSLWKSFPVPGGSPICGTLRSLVAPWGLGMRAPCRSCIHAKEGWAACRSEQSLPEGLWCSVPMPSSRSPGACIDDTILSRQGVENFARLPSLEVSQGQTVAALSLLSSQTSSLLQRGPSHLTALLDEHIRRLRDSGGATEPPPG
ncbi:RM10 protein, partial [Panurus biarmicus]|nr:RM10 protein [Panurus biarmicus]